MSREELVRRAFGVKPGVRCMLIYGSGQSIDLDPYECFIDGLIERALEAWAK